MLVLQDILKVKNLSGLTDEEVSEYANLGKEIGVAVNETLKAVEDSAIRIAESNLGQTAITIVVWKLLYKEIAGIVVGTILLGISVFMLLTGRGKLSKTMKMLEVG